ncbi:MAG TPA: beta-ketoacyl synthase N-terminal-like domain-containing protein [Polyangiales bacterium]|nr:beta-ketoacyl synthase N-terminal-like domain-containing protein [Polyangiales bacterium]
MIPCAITGLGLVTPAGIGYAAFERALGELAREPEQLFRGRPSLLDPEKIGEPMAAECFDFDAKRFLGDKGLRNFDRLTKLLIVSGKLALEDAGLKHDGVHTLPPDRIGLCSATAYGSVEAVTEAVKVTELEDPRFLNPNRFPNTVANAASGYVSIWEDLRAPNVTVVDGNCGALDAVLNGQTHLDNGRADAFLVGGGEALTELLYLAFRKLGVLAEAGKQCAPGDAHSQGMRLGEGAAYFCLEKLEFARARGARVRAQVLGYGNAFEPPESEAVLVHVSARAVERCIQLALADAQLSPSQIDVVAGALSGIAMFDHAELTGINAALGGEVPVAAPKTVFGETFGASGAINMACALNWLSGGVVAPLVRGSLSQPPRHVLVLSVGYYGNASAVVMRSAE